MKNKSIYKYKRTCIVCGKEYETDYKKEKGTCLDCQYKLWRKTATRK